MLTWGSYAPDVTDYPTTLSQLKEQYGSSDTCQRAENVLPRPDGFGPFPSPQMYTAALPAPCRGSIRALDSDGSILIIAGTATSLYALNNSTLTWGDVSKTATSMMTLLSANAIGNMTGGGGLAASVDGTTSQAIAACSSLASVTNTAYVGQHFATPVAVRLVKIFGSNDQGYVSGSNPTVIVNLYGKQGSTPPANATDGTLIGTLTFTDTANESTGRNITVTDLNTLWNYIWIQPTVVSSATLAVAELQLTGTFSYSLPAADQWSFSQFGNFVIATEDADPLQAYQLGSSTAFADGAGSPPQARFCAIVNEFLVLYGLLNNYNRIQWSALGDYTGWTAGVNQSDFQDFFDGGSVLGVAGGELTATVLQTNIIRRMTFQPGSDVIFSFDKVSDDPVGILAPLSLIRQGNNVFFLSNDGFQILTDGSVPVNIGKGFVDQTFLNEWDAANPQLMLGFPDPLGTRVYWAYKTLTGNAGFFDKILCYDWKLQAFSRITGISGEYATALAQVGVSVDSASFNATYPSIDAMTISFDDFPVAFGKQVSIFDTTNTCGFLSGPALQATIESSEQGNPGGQSYINGVRPITDATAVSAYILSRQNVQSTPVKSTSVAVDGFGRCPLHLETRHYRIGNVIPAGATWTFTAGVEVDARNTGGR